MKLSDIHAEANVLTDESITLAQVTQFVNQALSRINIECDANFPFFSNTDANAEPPFPEKWQRPLLVTFAAARIKQQDSSQFEYIDLFGEFERSLVDFKAKYVIPAEYKDGEASGSIAPDFTGSVGLEYGVDDDFDFMP